MPRKETRGTSNINCVLNDLNTLDVPEKAVDLQRFFKTGKGQYGEGDLFLGIIVPNIRKVAKSQRELPLKAVLQLLKYPHNEVRMCALFIMLEHYRRSDVPTRDITVAHYLKSTRYINNWDLVDLSAPGILGEHLLSRDRAILNKPTDSTLLWDQRIAMIATLTLIRNNEFDDTFRLAEFFLSHTHDLMHKAVGWMLREAGKRNRPRLTDFLFQHKHCMPRTMLRYAIAHYSESERKLWLQK